MKGRRKKEGVKANNLMSTTMQSRVDTTMSYDRMEAMRKRRKMIHKKIPEVADGVGWYFLSLQQHRDPLFRRGGRI